MRRRRFIKSIAACTLLQNSYSTSFAQESYPSRSVKVIIPFSPGSGTDVAGRIALEQLSSLMGQTFVIENKAGAGGSIGSSIIAKSDPNGYSLLINGAGHSAAPAVIPKLNYDPATDFSGIAMLGSVPNILIVSPLLGIKTIHQLVEKGRSSHLTYASAGIGSATHLAAERFRLSASIKGTHIPFKGGPEATSEVMSGRIDFACMAVASTISLINEGKLLPLAVSSPTRSSLLPNVPTTLESGLKDSDYTFWIGMFAPQKTPRSIIDKLHLGLNKSLLSTAVIERMRTQGLEPMPLSPYEIDSLIRKEVLIYKELVKLIGMKSD